jgi:hypothetical protein
LLSNLNVTTTWRSYALAIQTKVVFYSTGVVVVAGDEA